MNCPEMEEAVLNVFNLYYLSPRRKTTAFISIKMLTISLPHVAEPELVDLTLLGITELSHGHDSIPECKICLTATPLPMDPQWTQSPRSLRVCVR